MRAPFAIVLLAALLPAQANSGADKPAALDEIRAEQLLEHAKFLASDELGGRLTGTDGQARAAEYIAAHFAKLGLEPLGDKPRGGEPSFLQHYPIERTALVDDGTVIRVGDLEITDGWGMLLSAKLRKVEVKGKWVLVDPGGRIPKLARSVPVVILRMPEIDGGSAALHNSATLPIVQKMNATIKKLAKAGAKAVVFLLAHDHEGLLGRVNSRGLSPGKPLLRFGNARLRRPTAKIPALLFSSELSKKVLVQLGVEARTLDRGPIDKIVAEGKRVDGALRFEVETDSQATASNVVAVLRGSDKKLAGEAVLFSAHMDHVGKRLDKDVFNGADDNASGTSGLLAIAQAFAKAAQPPRRSIVFLAVSGEELGLWGSEYFTKHPAWDLKKIAANINTDMIGRDSPEAGAGTVAVTPSHEHVQFSTMVREAAEIAGEIGLELTSGDKYFTRSDHYNFAKAGIPVVFFCDGEHDDYHKVTDHADKLDGSKMEKIARLAFLTGWRTANHNGRPKRLGLSDRWTESPR